MEGMCLCKCGGRKDTLLLLDDPGAKSSVQLSIHVLLELSASFNTISAKLTALQALMKSHTPDFLAVPFSVFLPQLFLLIRKLKKVSLGETILFLLTCSLLGNLTSSIVSTMSVSFLAECAIILNISCQWQKFSLASDHTS